MPPVHLQKGIAQVNREVLSLLGQRPRFEWRWGKDLTAYVPRIDLDTNQRRKKSFTHRTKSGLYLVSHEDEMGMARLVPEPYWESFVFCFADPSPRRLAEWSPWCPPDAHTPDGRRVSVIHSAPNALPTMDYVREVCRVARIHLDILHTTTKENRERAAIAAATLTREQQERNLYESVRKAIEKLPAGGFRKAGDKSHISFSGAPCTPTA